MDQLTRQDYPDYPAIVKTVLQRYLDFYNHAIEGKEHVPMYLVVDPGSQHYLLASIGWEKNKRIFVIQSYIRVVDGKIWIEADETEEGWTVRLLEAGIPKEHIVIGSNLPEDRQYTEFAIT